MKYEQEVKNKMKEIHSISNDFMKKIEKEWEMRCKPIHSLGELEKIVIQLGGIQGTVSPKVNKKAVIIMAGDHGVVEEGVSQTGKEVTRLVVESMTKGKSAVCVMAKQVNAKVIPVDIGMESDSQAEGIVYKKVAYGTKNFTKEVAMTREQCAKAILVGIEVVKELSEQGYDCFAIGEMGIGNTTSVSAICSAYFSQPVEEMTGKGAGLSKEGYSNKLRAIKKALDLHKPQKTDIFDLVSKIGGLELAGMIGCFLGGAYYKKGMIFDGIISSLAAMLACQLCPTCKEYLFPSHCSKEPSAKLILEEIGLPSYFDLSMCMGEGTGAVMVFSLIEYALACYNEIPSFSENKIEQYVPFEDV